MHVGALEFVTSIDVILPAALWPWVDSACNSHEYQEYFLPPGIRAAYCFEIWEPQPTGTFKACPGLYCTSVALLLYFDVL